MNGIEINTRAYVATRLSLRPGDYLYAVTLNTKVFGDYNHARLEVSWITSTRGLLLRGYTGKNAPCLMSGFLTLVQTPTDMHLSQRSTAVRNSWRGMPTKSVFDKLKKHPLFRWYSLRLEAQAPLQPSYSKGWQLDWLKLETWATPRSWAGYVVGCSFCLLRCAVMCFRGSRSRHTTALDNVPHLACSAARVNFAAWVCLFHFVRSTSCFVCLPSFLLSLRLVPLFCFVIFFIYCLLFVSLM